MCLLEAAGQTQWTAVCRSALIPTSAVNETWSASVTSYIYIYLLPYIYVI